MATQLIPSSESKRVISSHRTEICIGGISLALSSGFARGTNLSGGLKTFIRRDWPAAIDVSVEWVDELHSFPGKPFFDSSALWKLFRCDDELIFDFSSHTLGSNPYKRLCTDDTFRSARLYLNHQLRKKLATTSPLEYPTDELLFTNYLAAHGLGVEVHGCGLIDRETGGHLFLGHSGAGKSTTAALWQSLRNPEILSDDRIILRIENGELWMHGTPWHGEGCFASPNKAKLNRILILQHDERNQMIEMSRGRAAAELFARSFPPFHSPEGLQNVMDFLHRVVNIVPCYEFGFVPDATAVETVIEMEHAAVA